MKRAGTILGCLVLVMVVSIAVIDIDGTDAETMMDYNDLQNQLNAGGVVVMTGNVVLQKDHPLTITGNVVLDMNGKSITVSNDFEGKPLINRGTLTITGNGTMDSSASDKADGAIVNYGKLTIENGTYTGRYLLLDHANEYGFNKGITLLNQSDAEVTINGGTFIGTSCAFMNFAYAVINDGSFTSRSCSTCDGGNFTYTIRNQSVDSVMIINGGNVKGVQGALSAAWGYLEVNGGIFHSVKCSENPAHGSYHACYAAGEYGEVETHINGGKFISESLYGYAIYIGNDTPGDGGIRDPAVGFITGGEFSSVNNVIYVAGVTGSVEITGGCFDREITTPLMPGYQLVSKESKWYVTTPVTENDGRFVSETTSAYAELPSTSNAIVEVLGATIDLKGDSNLGTLMVSVNQHTFTSAPDAVASFEISISCDTAYTADITVDAIIPDGYRALAYYINDDGELIPVEVVSYTSTTVTFRTTHTTPFVIMTEEIPVTPTTPGEEEEEYPFFPGQGTNVGPQDGGSDDSTTLVAAAAAIVVIMLAVVALMVTRNN